MVKFVPFCVLKIKFNKSVNNEEKLQIFEKYLSLPNIVSHNNKKCTIEFESPENVADQIFKKSKNNVSLEIDLDRRMRFYSPLILSVHIPVLKESFVKEFHSEVENCGGKVISEKKFLQKLMFLCEFNNFFESSKAFIELGKNYSVRFHKDMKNRILNSSKNINYFGNSFDRYDETGTLMEKENDVDEEDLIKVDNTRLIKIEKEDFSNPKKFNIQENIKTGDNFLKTKTNTVQQNRSFKVPNFNTFYFKNKNDEQSGKIIDIVLKNLQGFILSRKMVFKCDNDNVYYKIIFNGIENTKNALDVLKSLSVNSNVKLFEDYWLNRCKFIKQL